MRIKLTGKSFMRTVLCVCCIVLYVEALFMPICEIDNLNPALDDVITLTCKPNINDSRENITLTWFHDGKNISTDQRSGTVRVKLSSADYGVSFSCREVDVIQTMVVSCTLMPLPVQGPANAASSEPSSEPPSDYMSSDMSSTTEKPPDKRQNTIMILFIAIVAAGGLPILLSIIGCIVWVSRKTKKTSRSYSLQERPRSDSFDDFDTEAAVDSRPAAPLPGEVQAINMIKASSLKGSTKNRTPSVLKSLTEKEPVDPQYYAPPAELGSDSLYQNTAMGSQKMSSTLPLNTTSKNVYLVPNCNPRSSQDSLGEDKIYENTPSNKQKRFEADQTASLPNVRY